MDQKSDENDPILESSGQASQGKNRNSNGETSNSDNRLVFENLNLKNTEHALSDSGEIKDLDTNVNGPPVDQAASGGMRIHEPQEEGTSGDSSYLVAEVVREKMIVESEDIVRSRGVNKNLCIEIDELGLTGLVSDQRSESVDKFEQDPSHSNKAVVLQTVILVDSEESPSPKGTELEQSEVTMARSKTKLSEGKKQLCVVDVQCSGGAGGGGLSDCDGETVCRICHLSSEGITETSAANSSMELIQLGCGCKDELGNAHAYCAEAWFKLKGNRVCEICGEMAKNIRGVRDNRYVEEWNELRYIGGGSIRLREGDGGCWRGQTFCNILMGCLVMAFVLPWFLRVNMF